MAHFHNPSILGSSGNQNLQYRISRSLRFNSADSAYLSRTPGSAGNQKTYTLSMWIKRSKLGAQQMILGSYFANLSRYQTLFFNSSDQLEFFGGTYTTGGSAASTNVYLATSAVYRDVSAWYHFLLAVDTTQATDTNRVKLYVNGSQVTAFSTATYPPQNTESYINSVQPHYLGDWGGGSSLYFNGYIADVYLLDGTATTPSTFAETDAVTGQWVPKTPTSISYGTNGFRLTFSDNSGTTSTTLGKDAAGSNNWTPNNFSVASGSGNDSLVDSPSSYGTSTGVGGEVRGNYATLNPLINPSGDTFSNGNLQVTTSSSNYGTSVSTIAAPSSGKWYAEVTITATATYAAVGICSTSSTFTATSWIGSLTGVTYYGNTGNKYINGTGSSYGATFGLNDVIGIAYDADNLQITFYKNGSSQGTITGVTAGTYYFGGSEWDPASGTQVWNFGQRAFAYTAPSGFKALVDTNLTAPTIAKPADYFDALLWTGNSTNGRAITGLAFQPEFVWIKRRSASYVHLLHDAVRGFDSGWAKQLSTDSTAAEAVGALNGISSFNTGGFTLGVDGGVNFSGSTYVGWCWDAASSNSTNTSGTITSTVRANATAGFSIATYTGNGSAGATYGHGLGVAPKLIITKRRDSAQNWVVQPNGDGTKYLFLNLTDAQYSDSSPWNNTNPSSTLVTLGTAGVCNANGATYVSYAFAPVAGYSAFGSYTGNGSTDGPFVFTGFRPKYLMVKASSAGGSYYYWYVFDSVRDTANPTDLMLFPNVSDAESSTYDFDFLANGFKVRTNAIYVNNSAVTYIYCAFAESPFQYARAR